MDFMQRGGQARTNNLAPNAHAAAPAGAAPAPKPGDSRSKWNRIALLTLLFAGTILVVATLVFLAVGKGSYRENSFVQHDQLQAVFINVNGTNGGQVYFGNIQDLTPNFIRLTNVFYIQNQQGSSQSSSAYNLVKLGCELHGPADEMIINRSQVFFWENLKPDSQVAQKVAEFHKQNPNGQKCNDNSQSQQQSTNTQSSGSTAAPSTNNATNGTSAPANNSQSTAPSTTKKP